jgi:hypothetical protein
MTDKKYSKDNNEDIDPSVDDTDEDGPVVVAAPDSDEEIESARESVIREQEEASEEEDDFEEEEEAQGKEQMSFSDRAILGVAGMGGKNMANLKTRLLGKIVLSVKDKMDGYLFEWTEDNLHVEKWSGEPPAGCQTMIELENRDLELIVRGKLNPQVAMLSHKVNVSGEVSQAVYLFNLFGGQR